MRGKEEKVTERSQDEALATLGMITDSPGLSLALSSYFFSS